MIYYPDLVLQHSKYKGWRLRDVPANYFKWNVENKGKLRGPGDYLAYWSERELERRGLLLKKKEPKRVVEIKIEKNNERPQTIVTVTQDSLVCTVDGLDFQQEKNWF